MKQTEIRKCLFFVLSIAVLIGAPAPIRAAVSDYKLQADGAQLSVDGGTLRIQFWSPEIVRVTYAPGVELPELKSLSVVATPESVRLTQRESGEAFTSSMFNYSGGRRSRSGSTGRAVPSPSWMPPTTCCCRKQPRAGRLSPRPWRAPPSPLRLSRLIWRRMRVSTASVSISRALGTKTPVAASRSGLRSPTRRSVFP